MKDDTIMLFGHACTSATAASQHGSVRMHTTSVLISACREGGYRCVCFSCSVSHAQSLTTAHSCTRKELDVTMYVWLPHSRQHAHAHTSSLLA